ncbi:MAG: DUF3341 domain-containing protein [Candidatus Kapabacteria bacterium]|nr:DUF3341 domain-containing protein [Candidatus Kapabacteria bacterium]
MQEKVLYAMSALFDTPDAIIQAAESVQKAGYKKFDVNTPYPVHGMDNAMKLKPSTLGYFAFIIGIFGAIMAVAGMGYLTGVDYPNVMGGKPFFALPAFIPITFEVTVLSASVATVVIMIAFFFKLPNNSHPVHNTEYMKNVSDDKFGVLVEAKDAMFDAAKVEDLFRSLGASRIIPIYYDLEDIRTVGNIFRPKFVLFLAIVVFVSAGLTYGVLNRLLFIPPFTWMVYQPRVNAQQKSNMFADGSGMRNPVDGTVARGWMPYRYSGKPDEAGLNLVNPLIPNTHTLDLGKKNFDVYCSPCHGYLAKGDSRLRGQFPNPPTLHSDKVRNWTDGRIYAVITDGQNSMPSYSRLVSPSDRWAVILYIRELQRALNAKQEDLK